MHAEGARVRHPSHACLVLRGSSTDGARPAVVNRNLNPVYSSRGFHLFLPSVLLLLYVPLNALSALAANPSISDP
jgi:hypothetical protein